MKNTGPGNVYLNPDLGSLEVTANEDTVQDTDNEAEVSPDTTAALTKEGATGSAVQEVGEVVLDEVKNLVKKHNKRKKNSDNPVDNTDNSKKDSDNQVEKPPEPPAEAE